MGDWLCDETGWGGSQQITSIQFLHSAVMTCTKSAVSKKHQTHFLTSVSHVNPRAPFRTSPSTPSA
jgi:hypothetical protein